ncbi:hypothetical protein VmeM32_00196 [Vibrio phage vB_VmeM-32]|nr:hypothetical protein VmeM32_00196 [Vibrio phage vB_VmeM-32]
MNNLIQKLQTAILKANDEYIEKYGRRDSGTCGSAFIEIRFGRKTKLKKELIALGIIEPEKYVRWGSTYYNGHINRILTDEQRALLCPTQNVDFDECLTDAAIECLKAELDETQYDSIYSRTWID